MHKSKCPVSGSAQIVKNVVQAVDPWVTARDASPARENHAEILSRVLLALFGEQKRSL